MSAVNSIPWPVASEPIPSEESTAASLFHSFFDNAPVAVAFCDREGLITGMNAAFQHRLGAGITDRTSSGLRDVVCLEDRDKIDHLLRDLVESKRDSAQFSVRGADGREVTNCLAWRPAGFSGEVEGAIIVAETKLASEGEHATEDVFQAQRWEAIGRLAGGVVHDFNNLLTGMMLYCDLLLSALDPRDLRRRYAEEIRAAIVPASGLVRQLLVFARPQRTEPCPISFNEIVESMRDLLMRLVGGNIRLELRLDPQLGPVKMARSQAQQVLLNLLLNARDAMPEGGSISIETTNASFEVVASGNSKPSTPCLPCVLLSVTDNGRGMDAETRRRLFEPFFTTKTEKASGLGLATVQSIVTSHRGLIHYDSEPGSGTRVMILLPREMASSEPAKTEKTSVQITPAIPFQPLKKESHL